MRVAFTAGRWFLLGFLVATAPSHAAKQHARNQARQPHVLLSRVAAWC